MTNLTTNCTRYHGSVLFLGLAQYILGGYLGELADVTRGFLDYELQHLHNDLLFVVHNDR